MFTKARIKLTAWYLLIIMLISISFSLAIYKVLASELDRVERVQRLRIEHQLPERFRIIPPTDPDELPRSLLLMDPNIIEETKERLKIVLIFINLTILGASAAAGYFLAGRTLKPIRQMLDEQNRFIADASHELRTPLTSLKSALEVNLRDKHLTLGEAKILLIDNLEEVNKLQSLTDKLLQLSQYQKPQTRFQFEKLAVKTIIRKAVQKIEPQAKNKEIIIKTPASDYQIEANKESFCDLLVILLDNAIKYSPNKTTVRISLDKTDGFLNITVADCGAGINQKDLPFIFDRFFRAELARTKNQNSGYGLGLAIAQRIAQVHSGSITVISKVNKGSQFTLHLPLKQSFSLKKPYFSANSKLLLIN